MTPKTDNELIAEFIGLPLTKEEPEFTGDRKMKTVPFQRWKYHESWDWLMPVVEIIEKREGVTTTLKNKRFVIKDGKKTFSCHTIVKINSVYRVVVDYIKWHNSKLVTPGV